MAKLGDYATADPYEAAAIRHAEASKELWAMTARGARDRDAPPQAEHPPAL